MTSVRAGTGIRALLSEATRLLAQGDIPSPEWEARYLLADATGLSATDIRIDPDRVIDDPAAYMEWVRRRAAGEPLSRITGYRAFRGLDFRVSPDTLDPRIDSEVLVAEALATIPDSADWHIVDVGTGTGCLLLSILAERPRLTGTGIDISPGAVATAQGNAQALDLADRARFVVGNWLDDIPPGSVDMILSNPPYIESAEIRQLDKAVSRYDPMRALDGGPDGLDAYRAILSGAEKVLRPDALIVLEIGWNQGESVPKLLQNACFTAIRVVQDAGSRDRVVLARRPGG